ncbi:MAG TPA: hypothetical protein VKB32_05025 [Actinomycetota bacterium]|nr:hypothetical protein [Actinomycetota bacterium]
MDDEPTLESQARRGPDGEWVDPVVEIVTDAVAPIVETIRVAAPKPTAIVDSGLPLSCVIVPQPRSAEVVPEGRTAERTGSIGGDGFGGDLALAPASTTIAPSIDVSGAPASAATDEGSTGGPTLPLGWSGAGQSLTLLTLLAALTTTVRAFRHPILFSIVPRAVAMQSAALSLSVERPG